MTVDPLSKHQEVVNPQFDRPGWALIINTSDVATIVAQSPSKLRNHACCSRQKLRPSSDGKAEHGVRKPSGPPTMISDCRLKGSHSIHRHRVEMPSRQPERKTHRSILQTRASDGPAHIVCEATEQLVLLTRHSRRPSVHGRNKLLNEPGSCPGRELPLILSSAVLLYWMQPGWPTW